MAFVEAEMNEEVVEEEPPAGVGGAVHPEDWRYLRAGTESAKAPPAPQYAPSWACGWRNNASASSTAHGGLA